MWLSVCKCTALLCVTLTSRRALTSRCASCARASLSSRLRSGCSRHRLLEGCSALTKKRKSGGWFNSPENKKYFLGLVAHWPWSIVPITGPRGTRVPATVGDGWGSGCSAKPGGEPAQGDAVPLPAGWGLFLQPSPPAWLLPSLSAHRGETPTSDALSLFFAGRKEYKYHRT